MSEHHDATTESEHENHLTVYGATWCSDCKRAKKFLGEQRIHYDWVDPSPMASAAPSLPTA